jgi:glutamate-1-semialdehyde 2,1-aminomutase
MITPVFTRERVTGCSTAVTADTAAVGVFCRARLENGVYLPPSQFEAWFVSAAHTTRDIDATISAAQRAFTKVRQASAKS